MKTLLTNRIQMVRWLVIAAALYMCNTAQGITILPQGGFQNSSGDYVYCKSAPASTISIQVQVAVNESCTNAPYVSGYGLVEDSWNGSTGIWCGHMPRDAASDVLIEATNACDQEDYMCVTIIVLEVGSIMVSPGTKISDVGGTQIWLVSKAPSGSVTVTASSNPSLTEAQLTGTCWTTTGGLGDDLLTRTVDQTDVYSSTITFSAGTSIKNVSVRVVDVTLAVENNLTQCMEGRYVTFTATASVYWVVGFLDPIWFTFHYQQANGTPWTSEDWSWDRSEDNIAVADNVPDNDTDHYFTTPTYVVASKSVGFECISDILYIDVYELWIDYFRDAASSYDWKVVVGSNIAYRAVSSSDCHNWAWNMADGSPQ